MLQSLQRFFDGHVGGEGTDVDDPEAQLRLATAALFVEMTRADFESSPIELKTVLVSLRATLGIDAESAEELLQLAEVQTSEAVELFQFTRLVDRSFSATQKAEIIEKLWQVALADSRLDRHEEHLVRKIANLLHVPHREFIAAKKRARLR